MPNTSTTHIKVIRYFSIGIFLISLACPCYDTGKEDGVVGQGGLLLLSGIMWFMFMSPGFIWLANVCLLMSWTYASKKRDKSFIMSIVAILIALCFLLYKDMIIDEGGNTTPITGHRIGYWLWVASMLVMLLGNFYIQMFFGGDDRKPISSEPRR